MKPKWHILITFRSSYFQCCITSCDTAIGKHFDLTKLKSFLCPWQENVDILSFHLAATKSHDNIADDRDDCTSVGHKGRIGRNIYDDNSYALQT